VTLMKAIKNDVELAGFEACHVRDAAALCQYLAWLEKNVAAGQITEISGADQLEKFRSEQENFVGQFNSVLRSRHWSKNYG
jgi:Xaa-Pro aminopeptidase